MREMGLSNLPPGVRDCDIPGNRPEDAEYEDFCDRLFAWLDNAQIQFDDTQFSIVANSAWDWIDARRQR